MLKWVKRRTSLSLIQVHFIYDLKEPVNYIFIHSVNLSITGVATK